MLPLESDLAYAATMNAIRGDMLARDSGRPQLGVCYCTVCGQTLTLATTEHGRQRIVLDPVANGHWKLDGGLAVYTESGGTHEKHDCHRR